MAILDNLKNFFTKNSQRTAEAYNRAVYNYLGNSVVWNPENDDTYIDKGYRQNATIYSLVNLITKAAGTIPLQVYEKVNDGSYKKYRSLTSGYLDSAAIHKAQMIKKSAMVELKNTDLHALLERPNPAQSYNSFITEMLAFGLLTGNRYLYGIGPDTGDNIGKYNEIYVLPSQKMEIISGGLMQPVSSYALNYNGTFKIPAENICHIKDFNPYYDGSGSNLYGQSPLKAGLRSLTTNNEAVTTGVKYLQNQTARGILTTQEEDGINEMQAQQLKDKFRKAHQGSDNAGDIIITPKKMSWVNFGLSATDLNLIEQYNASIKDLCNIYNVPVQLLNNTDSSTYNNMKEARKALYLNAVIPQLNKVRDELNRWLAPKYGDNVCIDFDYSSIAELQEESEKIVAQMSASWWLTPNEKREAMSYGVDVDNDSLNDYYIPANLMPVGGIDMPLVGNPELNDIPVDAEAVKPDNNLDTANKPDTMPEADIFDTEAEAEARAEDLGGSGSHTHEDENGNTIYMPFNTHAQYDAAVNKSLKKKDNLVSKAESYDDYPQSATNNAKRVKNWIDEHGRDEVRGMTNVGLSRMNQLIKREALSLSTLKRTFSFLSRNKGGGDNKINPDYRDTPWRDKGYVAYLGWGGESMLKYAERKLNQLDDKG